MTNRMKIVKKYQLAKHTIQFKKTKTIAKNSQLLQLSGQSINQNKKEFVYNKQRHGLRNFFLKRPGQMFGTQQR